MELIREVGAYAGLAAFFGLAVLALLYFAQARDVRRLRENASFLVEGPESANGEQRAAVPAAAATGEPAATGERAADRAEDQPVSDAEAFRRAELARQAAERRRRFEERQRGGGQSLRERLPDATSLAVIVVGALILLAGIGFAASQLLGGDEEPAAGGAEASGLACRPADTKVAVLNGTSTQGLAGQFATDLKARGYDVGPVTNTESSFEQSVVMWDEGGRQCAGEIGGVVTVQRQRAVNAEVQELSEGAPVIVVLGDDKAAGG